MLQCGAWPTPPQGSRALSRAGRPVCAAHLPGFRMMGILRRMQGAGQGPVLQGTAPGGCGVTAKRRTVLLQLLRGTLPQNCSASLCHACPLHATIQHFSAPHTLLQASGIWCVAIPPQTNLKTCHLSLCGCHTRIQEHPSTPAGQAHHVQPPRA